MNGVKSESQSSPTKPSSKYSRNYHTIKMNHNTGVKANNKTLGKKDDN